jgi:hypothetical protein
MQRFRLVTTRPVFLALALLLVINGLLYLFNPLAEMDPERLLGARSWAWWAVQDYKKIQPDVVFIGSSMVMHPLWHQEAQFRQQNVELIVDHRSTFVESMLNKAAGKPVKVFNFGLPGGMASDAFIIVRALSQMPTKPKVAVLCFNPRDMMDNSFGCAATSRHYDLFSRLVDTSDVGDSAHPKLLDKGKILLRDCIFFKRKNKELRAIMLADTKELSDKIYKDLPASLLDKVSPEKTVQFAFQNDELEQGFWIAKPNVPRWYVEASKDCKRRLRNANTDVFENQVTFLDLCLKECRKNGIYPVLVNMPTTPIMREAMPQGVYERHVTAMHNLAKKYAVEVIEANTPIYKPEDFTDWAHMHATGGEKAFGLIARELAANQLAVKQMASPSQLATTKEATQHAF